MDHILTLLTVLNAHLAAFDAPFEYWYWRLGVHPLVPLLVLNALDAATSMYAFRKYPTRLYEYNGKMRRLFASFGIDGAFVLKMAIVAALWFFPTYHFLYAIATLGYVGVVVNNIVRIAAARAAAAGGRS